MIRRSPGRLGIDPAKPKTGQIEFLDKDVDRANRIVLADPVFQAFRKQRGLTAIDPQRSASSTPPQIAAESYRENQMQRVFTQPGSFATIRRCLPVVRLALIATEYGTSREFATRVVLALQQS